MLRIPRRPSRLLLTLWLVSGIVLPFGATATEPALLKSAELSGVERSRLLHVQAPAEAAAVLKLELFDGQTVTAEHERSFRNRSGSVSWVGRVRGESEGRFVMVTRDGVTVASIRVGDRAYLLHPAAAGSSLSVLHQVDPASPAFLEDPPTEVRFTAAEHGAAEALVAEMQAGTAAQDDGSVQDLLVVYTPAARDQAGGTTAVENLIDLGVTDTNLSYEASGIHHRLRLAHAQLIDYDEYEPFDYGPRDRLRIPDDGHMDQVHPLRDLHRADLVMLLIGDGGGCGEAYIMGEVSLAFEAWAFAVVNWRCVTPRYTFQHELGHIQGGRHGWGGDSVDNAPFTFNHGYADFDNEFYTIMYGGAYPECPACTRRLAWSNPDRPDPQTGAATGIPEGEPMACDNRKTLNATAWTVANFRVSAPEPSPIFSDDFETGDLTRWSLASP